MKTLLIFPIFVLFIFAAFSFAGNSYYTGVPAFNYTVQNATQGYGLTYQIMPNGTVVFSNPSEVVVDIHAVVIFPPYTCGAVIYSFNWSAVDTIGNDGTISFNNGTASIFVGYNVGFISCEFQHWYTGASLPLGQEGWSRLDGHSFYDYITHAAIAQNDATQLGGQANFPFLFDINGAMLAIVGIIAMAAVIGITAFASGISDFAQEVILKGTFLFAFWGILSVFAFPMFAQIYFVGVIFYVALTIMYLFGFITQVGTKGSDGGG